MDDFYYDDFDYMNADVEESEEDVLSSVDLINAYCYYWVLD